MRLTCTWPIGVVVVVVIAGSCGGDSADSPDAAVAAIDGGRSDATASVADAATEPVLPDGGPVDIAEAGQFALSNLCGLGFDHTSEQIWTYTCSGTEIESYDPEGTPGISVPRRGESANDVDIDFSPTAFTLGETSISSGSLLFINGETDVAEIYAIDKSSGAELAVLVTAFGASHVVGGAYHATRGTLFLIQDKQAGSDNGNLVAEVSPITGAIINTFSVATSFGVNFGDLDVCQSTGNLFIVSSDQSAIAEFTAAGALVATHPLPQTVVGVSGIDMGGAPGDAWVADRSGNISKLSGLPCP